MTFKLCVLIFSAECLPDEYRCRNNEKCVPNNYKCDYINDCDDNSDEVDGCKIRLKKSYSLDIPQIYYFYT